MIDELPELGNIFPNTSDNIDNKENDQIENKLIDDDIYIYISKNGTKWLSVTFLDVAPSDIGIHVLLPMEINFTAEELDKVTIKFEKKTNNKNVTLKKAPVLVRWQDKNPISGKMKIGLHFHGNIKTDPTIIEILKKLKNQK